MEEHRQSSELQDALARLEELITRNDLAALIVHLNDTYLIEARPGDLPGMARVARLVKWLRRYLHRRIGQDRLLVVHAGDILSPSYISNTLGAKGEQMIAALNECGVDFATLGNHEFDFGLQHLRKRLAQARFPFVLSNFAIPHGSLATVDHALWPPEQPYLAILAFGGSDVRKKAESAGFSYQSVAESLRRHMDRIKADPRILGLVILTHMDRSEDHELVELARAAWPRPCCGYVLGGHDHDMAWYERGGNVVFSKNLANCRTVTLVPVAKSALMVPTHLEVRYPSREREIEFMKEVSSDASMPPVNADRWPTVEAAIKDAFRSFLRSIPRSAPRDFKRVYAGLMKAAALQMDAPTLRREAYNFTSAATLDLYAQNEAMYAWNEPLVIGNRGALLSLREDPSTKAALRPWLEERERKAGPHGSKVIKDFSAVGVRFDATEACLRSRSTNFGNFIADAVKHASHADVALLHAGCFRADDTFGPVITLTQLQETFLYDDPGSIHVVDLAREEVDAFYRHAATKVGAGAFLQVSDALDKLPAHKQTLRVAICGYLLDPESNDGYVEVLAAVGGSTIERGSLTRAFGSIVDLVAIGAGAVEYSDERRLAPQQVEVAFAEREARGLIELLRRYSQAARLHGVDWQQSCQHLEGIFNHAALDDARREVWVAIYALMRKQGTIRLDEGIYKFVRKSRESYVEKVDYGVLLEKAWGSVYFDVSQRWLREQREKQSGATGKG